jgi:hypothetical protein
MVALIGSWLQEFQIDLNDSMMGYTNVSVLHMTPLALEVCGGIPTGLSFLWWYMRAGNPLQQEELLWLCPTWPVKPDPVPLYLSMLVQSHSLYPSSPVLP